MNAQQIINETPVNHFDWKVFWKLQSSKVNNLPHSDDKEGDKFVARQGNNQHPQARITGSNTSYPVDTPRPLIPQTSDILSNEKININNIKNTETAKGDVIRSMEIEIL